MRGSDKSVDISFDECNIWYDSRFENVDKIEGTDNWPRAPRLLEDVNAGEELRLTKDQVRRRLWRRRGGAR